MARDFRKSYYSMVGGPVVDVKSAVSELLRHHAAAAVDVDRLARLTRLYRIPSLYRATVWAMLLGTTTRALCQRKRRTRARARSRVASLSRSRSRSLSCRVPFALASHSRSRSSLRSRPFRARALLCARVLPCSRCFTRSSLRSRCSTLSRPRACVPSARSFQD